MKRRGGKRRRRRLRSSTSGGGWKRRPLGRLHAAGQLAVQLPMVRNGEREGRHGSGRPPAGHKGLPQRRIGCSAFQCLAYAAKPCDIGSFNMLRFHQRSERGAQLCAVIELSRGRSCAACLHTICRGGARVLTPSSHAGGAAAQAGPLSLLRDLLLQSTRSARSRR